MSKKSAIGTSYIISDSPFLGQTGLAKNGKPVCSPKKGERVKVVAGHSPVYVGGNTASWDGCYPVIILPGGEAICTLKAGGGPYDAAEWEIEEIEEI